MLGWSVTLGFKSRGQWLANDNTTMLSLKVFTKKKLCRRRYAIEMEFYLQKRQNRKSVEAGGSLWALILCGKGRCRPTIVSARTLDELFFHVVPNICIKFFRFALYAWPTYGRQTNSRTDGRRRRIVVGRFRYFLQKSRHGMDMTQVVGGMLLWNTSKN